MDSNDKRAYEEALERIAEAAQRDLFPKLRSSIATVALLHGEPDVKLCLEVGASLLLDKPLVLIVHRGFFLPERLRRIAGRVVEIDSLDNPADRERIEQALRWIDAHRAKRERKT